MRAVRAKKLLTQARKNARTGKVDIQSEYDRLKKKYKTRTQAVNSKTTRRQKRLKGYVYHLPTFQPKLKAHKFRRP